MNPLHEFAQQQTRRQFFASAGLSVGGIALASLLGQGNAFGASKGARMHPALAGFPHFAPKAKRLIYLHMNGAPAQMDLFDYKPQLADKFDPDPPHLTRQG